MTHELWEELNAAVYGFLASVSLAQLVEKQHSRPVTMVRDRARSPHVPA